MVFIAHRGNIEGKHADENKPDYIKSALAKGFDVEVDIWFSENKWYLGHDYPKYEVDQSFVKKKKKLWFHAKTPVTLNGSL